MADNVTINVQQDNDIINIVSSQVTEVIDINVAETTEEVTLNITEEIIQVNINKVTGGGGNETLAETLDIGNNTGGNDILLNNADAIQLENGSSVEKGTYDFGQQGGVSRICGVGFEDMWQGGIRHVFDSNGLIRNSSNGFNLIPNNSFDVTLRFKVGSIWTLDDGTSYVCIDATTGAAIWEILDNNYTTAEKTKVSNLSGTNTGDQDLSGKVDKVTGKELSTNDFTNTLKTKLDGIASGAEVNVNADWNATSGDAQILNKPTIPAAQVNSDWNATSGLAQILNKPSLTGFGDMLKSTYDTDNTGVVDNAEAIKIIGRNSTGVTLYRGTVIYISGSTGNRPNFVKAQANTESTSAGTFGVIADDLANNSDGYALALGYLDNLDTRTNASHPFTTDTLADGDTIYLSPTNAGYITNVKPSAPNHLVYLGKVTRTSPTNGTIVYRVQNGYELEELHNVAISSVANEDFLRYETSTSLWKNVQITTSWILAKLGITILTGSNTGDETTATIKTKLGITTLSGSNTGDQDLSGYVPTTRTVNAKALSSNITLTTADISDSTGKRYQTENQNTFNDATSSIQNQLNNKLAGVHTLKTLPAGQSTTLSINGTTITTASGIANRITLLPYIPNVSFTSANLYINVSTLLLAANARILIYSDVNGVPTTKLYESANLDCSTIGIKTATTAFSFVAGTTYWLAVHSSSNPIFSAYNISQIIPFSASGTVNYISYISSQTFGSAPTTLTGATLSSVVPTFIAITF